MDRRRDRQRQTVKIKMLTNGNIYWCISMFDPHKDENFILQFGRIHHRSVLSQTDEVAHEVLC